MKVGLDGFLVQQDTSLGGTSVVFGALVVPEGHDVDIAFLRTFCRFPLVRNEIGWVVAVAAVVLSCRNETQVCAIAKGYNRAA